MGKPLTEVAKEIRKLDRLKKELKVMGIYNALALINDVYSPIHRNIR